MGITWKKCTRYTITQEIIWSWNQVGWEFIQPTRRSTTDYSKTSTRWWISGYTFTWRPSTHCLETFRNHCVRLFKWFFNVDANHADNILNRTPYSVILIYVNNTPVIWYCKRQNTVEYSYFGSKFVAFRIANDLVEALSYKIWCFGVPLDGTSNILCYNKPVVMNVSVSTSMLNKRHNTIFTITWESLRRQVRSELDISQVRKPGISINKDHNFW